MAHAAAGPGQEDYASLITQLAAFRNDWLNHQPSDHALARAAGVTVTTIGNWLRGKHFPQKIDSLLAVLRAVRVQAERAGLAGDPAVAALLDEERWRGVHRAEAERRADGTRTAVQAAQGRAVLEQLQPGWPLSEVTDPFRFNLEVHHAIDAPIAGLPQLPAYVPREHDRALGEVVAAAAAGTSGIAVLVGGSSTGKTRACWEALTLLREFDQPWRLWHPIDPTRPDAALAELHNIAPYTVVWLNEAQLYLAPEKVGEQVAAGLRELLRDRQHRPVLILATLWPDHWDTLSTRTNPDAHAHARELLDGHDIRVPDAFTGATLDALAGLAGEDPRLGEAAEHAEDGQITQYLAGVPVLLSRYAQAVPATKELIHAAMDARRLGAGLHLPLALLADAAPGYLTDTQWHQTGEDWLQGALDYVTRPCKGIPGILVPVKPGTPRNQRTRPTAHHTATRPRPGPLYRLTDYLDQHGRRHRADQIPPIDFWTAAAAHAHPTDLTALGNAARARGLYRDAAQLHKKSTDHGDPYAAIALIRNLYALHPGDHCPATWAVDHAALNDPNAVAFLLRVLRGAGADEQAAALLARDPAAHAPLDDPNAVTVLLRALREAGADEQAAALLARAAAHAPLDNPYAVADLVQALREAGADEQAAALLARDPAAHAPLDNPYAVADLVQALREAGADEQAAALLARAAAHAPLDDPNAVTVLLRALRRAGADEQAAALLARAAAHAPLDDPNAVTVLLRALHEAGAHDQAAALLARDPAAHAPLDDPNAVADLVQALHEAGAHDQAAALLARAAAHAPLDDPNTVTVLLRALRRAGADEQAAALLARAAAHAPLDDPNAVTVLLRALHEAGADEQAAALLARAAAHAPLDDPNAVADLVQALREAGAHDQAAALLARAAAHAPLDDPNTVTVLLRALHEAGAHDQAAALLARDPAAHAPLDDPNTVTVLLRALHEAGAHDQAAALLARAAAHAPLDDPNTVTVLLRALHEAGADEQAAALAEQLPAAGLFDVFLKTVDHQGRFRFGREPNGNAAAAWGWEDLE